MCGYMRFDKIRNKVIRRKISVASIEDTIRDTRLRWLDHITSMNAPVRRCEQIDRPTHRRRSRSKKSWSEVIRHDLKTLALLEDMARDRKLLRSRIKIADFR